MWARDYTKKKRKTVIDWNKNRECEELNKKSWKLSTSQRRDSNCQQDQRELQQVRASPWTSAHAGQRNQDTHWLSGLLISGCLPLFFNSLWLAIIWIIFLHCYPVEGQREEGGLGLREAAEKRVRDERSMTDEAKLRSLLLSLSLFLSFFPSNLASNVEPRGSGNAMSPFPHNPSPLLAADGPGLGLLLPELHPRARCQLQSTPSLLTSQGRPNFWDKRQEGFSFVTTGRSRILTVVIPP